MAIGPITKSGNRLQLELSSRLVFRDGKPVGVQGVARDITERKQVENVLARQADRAALIRVGLIAYQAPLYQVLALEDAMRPVSPPVPPARESGPERISLALATVQRRFRDRTS